MKTFTLFRRDAEGRAIPTSQLPQHRDRPWYFRFEFRERTYTRCLGSTASAEAPHVASENQIRISA